MKGKKNYLWILSILFGVLGILCFILSFFWEFLIKGAIICSLLGMIIGILSKKNIGFILNGFTFLGIVLFYVIGTFFPVEAKLDGTWIFNEGYEFQLKESGEECIWSFQEEYYKGICDYDFASKSKEEMEKTKHSYVLYMELQEVKSEGEIIPADEFLEMEKPYFKFQISLNEKETEGTFYNPISEKSYSVKKKEV